MTHTRRDLIAATIRAELREQAGTPLDIEALATAIDRALPPGAPAVEPEDDGMTPGELNASNDD